MGVIKDEEKGEENWRKGKRPMEKTRTQENRTDTQTHKPKYREGKRREGNI